jgi:hypothetical protein
MSAQANSALALEQRFLFVEMAPLGAQEFSDETSGLRQQGAVAFTTSFPSHADKWRCFQVEVTRRQVEQFLNAGAGIIE